MTKKISIADLSEFDPVEHLKDEADIAAYLTVVIEEGNSSELAHALGVVARLAASKVNSRQRVCVQRP